MIVGNHVRRINGIQFIGVITKIYSREADEQTMVCVMDSNGGVAVGPEGDFEIMRH